MQQNHLLKMSDHWRNTSDERRLSSVERLRADGRL